MSKQDIDSVICFGGEDWWYHNRAHIDMQMMKRYARDYTTLYINSIVMQKPKLGKDGQFFLKCRRKLKSIFTGLKKSDVGFWVYSPFSLPFHHIACLRWLNKVLLQFQLFVVRKKLKMIRSIVWVACPAACDIAIAMKKEKLVLQRTDRFEEFPNVVGEQIAAYDRRLKQAADLTLFVNMQLYDEEQQQCRKALYLDHGVDFDLFDRAKDDPQVPEELKDVPGPIIGFYGSFGSHTTDVKLLEEVADLLPEMSFVFVGHASDECRALAGRKNVYMVSQKAYEQIPHFGKCFDVCLMPWKQNRWIEACNPIKLKEYLALGKPVVSTPYPELEKYAAVVYQGTDAVSYAEAIKKALAEDNPKAIAKRKEAVQDSTWDAKAQVALDVLFEKVDN